VYDSISGTAAHFRVEYDIKTTQDKIEECGLPEYLVFLVFVGVVFV
jgi:hypothetical protein